MSKQDIEGPFVSRVVCSSDQQIFASRLDLRVPTVTPWTSTFSRAVSSALYLGTWEQKVLSIILACFPWHKASKVVPSQLSAFLCLGGFHSSSTPNLPLRSQLRFQSLWVRRSLPFILAPYTKYKVLRLDAASALCFGVFLPPSHPNNPPRHDYLSPAIANFLNPLSSFYNQPDPLDTINHSTSHRHSRCLPLVWSFSALCGKPNCISQSPSYPPTSYKYHHTPKFPCEDNLGNKEGKQSQSLPQGQGKHSCEAVTLCRRAVANAHGRPGAPRQLFQSRNLLSSPSISLPSLLSSYLSYLHFQSPYLAC